MQKQIWKFNLTVNSNFEIEMPKGAQILSVQSQNNRGVMWALCDTQAEKEKRAFQIYGTGHNMPSEGIVYVGTFQQADQTLVWHLFEKVQ